MIEVHQLAKRFGSVEAVRSVSFQAEDGTITGLLGPNGAGKTTTMRMIYGILQPDAGYVTIDGIDVNHDRIAAQRALAALPDSKGLYARLTSREHMRFYGQLHGMQGSALETRIEQVIAMLEMAEIADRRVDGFSQGQRLKVAIARAIVHNPRNIVLDEPTNGLDVMSTRAMRTVIRRMRDEGCCVLFSSHIMQEVAALCERVVVIANGTVTAAGTPEDLRRQTGQANLEDAFVAAVGSEEGLAL